MGTSTVCVKIFFHDMHFWQSSIPNVVLDFKAFNTQDFQLTFVKIGCSLQFVCLSNVAKITTFTYYSTQQLKNASLLQIYYPIHHIYRRKTLLYKAHGSQQNFLHIPLPSAIILHISLHLTRLTKPSQHYSAYILIILFAVSSSDINTATKTVLLLA